MGASTWSVGTWKPWAWGPRGRPPLLLTQTPMSSPAAAGESGQHGFTLPSARGIMSA
jgi:hypothetical protein